MNEQPKIVTTKKLLLRGSGETLGDTRDIVHRATEAGVPDRAALWHSDEVVKGSRIHTVEFVWKDES